MGPGQFPDPDHSRAEEIPSLALQLPLDAIQQRVEVRLPTEVHQRGLEHAMGQSVSPHTYPLAQ